MYLCSQLYTFPHFVTLVSSRITIFFHSLAYSAYAHTYLFPFSANLRSPTRFPCSSPSLSRSSYTYAQGSVGPSEYWHQIRLPFPLVFGRIKGRCRVKPPQTVREKGDPNTLSMMDRYYCFGVLCFTEKVLGLPSCMFFRHSEVSGISFFFRLHFLYSFLVQCNRIAGEIDRRIDV